MRAEPGRIVAGAGKALAVLLLLLWSLGPIAVLVLSSFKPGDEIFAAPPRLTFEPTIRHYATLWTRWGAFFEGLRNSLVVTTGATLLAVAASTAAGFVLSRRPGRIASTAALLMVVARLLPPIVVTLPLFPIVNWLRLNDTHAVLVVLYATFFVSLGALLMRSFIDQVPRELDEAALVDGAGHVAILVRVVAPLAAQGMLALAVFVIVFAWNEFLFAFIFTSTRAKTAPLVVSEMLGSFDGIDWGVLFAAATVQLAPILAFVILMQRNLVAGLTAGAVKG